MPDQNFASLEALDHHFALKLAEAPEEQRIAVELEKANATTSFFRNQAQEKDKSIWSQSVLAKFPRARLTDLRGDTEADLEASAKEAHERIEAALAERETEIRAELEKQLGRAAYAGGVGGGTPVVDANSIEATNARSESAWQNRGQGGGRRLGGQNPPKSDVDTLQRATLDVLTKGKF